MRCSRFLRSFSMEFFSGKFREIRVQFLRTPKICLPLHLWVYMKNLVYIWYIFVGGFSWDFKPIYLVYYKAAEDNPIVVLKLYNKV